MIDLTKNNQFKKNKQVFICKNCGRILCDPNSDRCLTCGVKIDKDRQLEERRLKEKAAVKNELNDKLEEKIFCKKCGNNLGEDGICPNCNTITIKKENFVVLDRNTGNIEKITEVKFVENNILLEAKEILINILSGNIFKETTGSKIRKYKDKEVEIGTKLFLEYNLPNSNMSLEEYYKFSWIISIVISIIFAIIYMINFML